MNIYVVNSTSKTSAEWLASSDKKLHSDKMRSLKAGAICVLSNLEERCFEGFAVLGGECALSDPLDEKVYSGEDAKYNKYVLPLERYVLFPKPVSYEEVAHFCGIPVGDKTLSNIYKGGHSYTHAFYGKGGEPSLILDRFHALVLSWVAMTM
jgi:hypothetical protein